MQKLSIHFIVLCILPQCDTIFHYGPWKKFFCKRQTIWSNALMFEIIEQKLGNKARYLWKAGIFLWLLKVVVWV